MALTDLIKEQAGQCVVMFGAGIAFMFFFQLCSLASKRIALNKWLRAGIELIFWLATAVMISQFLYYCAYGSLSLHTGVAFGAGVLLWKKFFYGIMDATD